MSEQEIYDDTVKIHLMAVRLLAERNLLRWDQIDLGQGVYGKLIPEKDTWNLIYSWPKDSACLILGATCKEVRDSLVTITRVAWNTQFVCLQPLRAISTPEWSGDLKDLWPLGWFIDRNDKLSIEVRWNGKEKPGILSLCYLQMLR